MTTTTHDTTEATQARTDTASRTVRGWATFLCIGGGVALLTPAWPVGLCMIGVGCFFAIASHVVEPVECAAIAEAEANGGGCGWLALAMLMIVAVGLLGLALLGAIAASGVRL